MRRMRKPMQPRSSLRRRSATASPARYELVDKVEAALVGLTHFIAGLIATLARLIFRPLSLDQRRGGKGWLAREVSPHVFLAFTAFVATNAVRMLSAGFLLLVLTVRRCSAPESQLEIVQPKVADLLKLPSIDDVVLTPLVLRIGCFARAAGANCFEAHAVWRRSLPRIVHVRYWLPVPAVDGDGRLRDGWRGRPRFIPRLVAQ
ncbi:MAG: hypothetical protein EON54_10145 [Alcaligenaceae bacterium]|nr:MAG: hypothetical protein EON54_10145 [Alcaligenaceae bacterium]